MTPPARETPRSSCASSASEEPDAFVVTVRDDVDERISGHRGATYISPSQSHANALALVGLLVGRAAADDGRPRWRCPVPGGRRTITLTPARLALPEDEEPPTPPAQPPREAFTPRLPTEQIATRSQP